VLLYGNKCKFNCRFKLSSCGLWQGEVMYVDEVHIQGGRWGNNLNIVYTASQSRRDSLTFPAVSSFLPFPFLPSSFGSSFFSSSLPPISSSYLLTPLLPLPFFIIYFLCFLLQFLPFLLSFSSFTFSLLICLSFSYLFFSISSSSYSYSKILVLKIRWRPM
jgi:hypothetical protein